MFQGLIKLNYKLIFFTVFSATICITYLSSLTLAQHNQSQKVYSTKDFIDSIGVAVHLNYLDTAYAEYGNIIKPRLLELGVRHIRGGVKFQDQKTLDKFNDLGTLGIKSTIVMDPRRIANAQEAVKIAEALSNSIEAVEGPNEWDLHPKLQYKGKNFPQGVRQFQQELYEDIKANPKTESLLVLCPSLGRPNRALKLGNLPCDLGNMHSYAGGRKPTRQLYTKWIPNANIVSGNQPIVATECGYHNAINQPQGESQPAVSEQASAKYLSRLFLEYFNRGIQRAYTYELIDLKPNSKADDAELNFGLLRNDGSPKPGFVALKNLIAILRDSDLNDDNLSSNLKFNYKTTGNIKNIHQTVLQKSDGRIYLIFWKDVLSFDLEKNQDIEVERTTIDLEFNDYDIIQALIYEPLISDQPLQDYHNPQRITVNVPDYPLVVELLLN